MQLAVIEDQASSLGRPFHGPAHLRPGRRADENSGVGEQRGKGGVLGEVAEVIGADGEHHPHP